MKKNILIALGVVVVALVIAISTRPVDFKISRSATIIAQPAVVFGQVNDLHKWNAWSPWAKLDPNAKNTFEGPAAGTGAIMSWVGNNKVGEGSMTITESRPSEFIQFKLDFLKPFKATSTAEFTFKAEGSHQTVVTWAMMGHNNFIAKAISLFMDCDKMMGGTFERGLAQLKSVAESISKK